MSRNNVKYKQIQKSKLHKFVDPSAEHDKWIESSHEKKKKDLLLALNTK